jgi:hypothetical protein
MDPEACLKAAEEALAEGDHEEVRERLEDYRGWRSRGGFEPENGDMRANALRRAMARVASEEEG